MQKLKKPLSILLSLIMILSVFTIIPMSASAAEGDTVSVFARKWVRAEVVNGDYFRVSDLYEGFKICRVNPNGGFDSTNLSTTQGAVWNQTGDMSLNDSNRNGGNKLTINSWDLTAAWGIDPGRQNDGYIYLSTHETNGINYNDGAQWWFYTWEVFSATEHAAVSPTYDAATGEYQNGTATAYYTAGDRYFIADGSSYTQVSYADLFTMPYFEYEYLDDIDEIRLEKCNSDDADITVPDTIPAQFYPEDAPEGMGSSIIKEEAFKDRTSLVNVTIGDNVNHIAGKNDDEETKGAFCGCTSLETVTVGSSLDYVGYNCFEGCTHLTGFTTASTREGNFNGVDSVAYDNKDNITLRVQCYHNSSLARELSAAMVGEVYYVDFDYLDTDPVVHTYEASWDWDSFDDDGKVYVRIYCQVCDIFLGEFEATVSQVVDTPAACGEEGEGHYKATVTYDGQTFEDDDDGDHHCTIPATGNHDWDTTAENVSWTWTPSGGDDPGLSAITAIATVHCKNCSATQDVNAVVERTGYDMPGCTTVGYSHYTASAQCGVTLLDTKDYILPSYGGHDTFVHHDAAAATCTADGNNEYWQCDRCGKYFADDQGNTELTYPDEVVIPAAHTLVHHPFKDQSGINDGNIEYWQCSVCGKYFSDANGEHEITQAQTVIKGARYLVSGRAYALDGVCASNERYSFNKTNLLYYTGDTPVPHVQYYNNYILSFNYGNGKITTQGLNSGGYPAAVRTDEDYAFSGLFYVTEESVTADGATVNAYVINPLYVKVSSVTDDNWSWDTENNINSASVTLTDYYYYTDGGYQQMPSGVVLATLRQLRPLRQTINANVTSVETTPHTCTTEGVLTYTATATKINATFTKTAEAVSPAAHTLTFVPGTEPTATQNGNLPYYVCSVCGKYFNDETGGIEITDKSSVILPALNTVREDKVFAVTDPIVFPEGTKLEYRIGSQTVTVDEWTFGEDTVFEDGLDYDTYNGNKVLKADGVGAYLVSIITNEDDYAFTGYYTLKKDSDNVFVVKPLYIKKSTVTSSSWTWTSFSAASVTLDDFYIWNTNVFDPFTFEQTIDATVETEDVSPKTPTCLQDGIILHTATAKAYEGEFTDSKLEYYAGPHSLTHVDEIPATCSATGTREYWECELCGKYFSDENGENEIDEPAVIPTIDHTWRTTWSDEAPVLNGQFWEADVTYTCSVCSETETVKAYARDTDIQTVEATCMERGYKLGHFQATHDGMTSEKDIKWDYTELAPHTPEHFDAEPPTYNRKTNTMTIGNVDCWICTECGKSFTDEACSVEIENPVIYYFDIIKTSSGEVILDKYNGTDTEVFIPDTVPDGCADPEIRGENIVTINAYSFKDNTDITKVTMGDNITVIGWQAFMGCTNLKEVYIGSGIYRISAQSFYGCDSLTDFYCAKTGYNDEGANLFIYNTFNTDTGFTFHGAHSGVFYNEAHTPAYINEGSGVFPYIGTDAHTYHVTFNWDGYTCTTATVTCEHCDFNETLNDVNVTSEITTEPTVYADGLRTYTASVVYEGNTYTDTKTEIIPKIDYFPKHSLTLNGDIGVNFYLSLTADELAQGVTVDFAWNGKSDSVTFNSNSQAVSKPGAEGLYKATCYVCAAEMNDEITASLTIGDAAEPIATETYKVRDYADVIIANEDGKFTEEAITLVKTMLNYGASAQEQFKHNQANPANAGVGYDLVSLTPDEIGNIDRDIPDKESMNSRLANAGIEYYGYSLILKTETTLRFYFKKNGADTSKLALLNTDDENVAIVHDYNDQYCYIEIADIPASKLDDLYELKYDDISLGGFSALSYVKDVLKNDGGAQPITDTATALYRYNEAAVIYFNSIAQGGGQ